MLLAKVKDQRAYHDRMVLELSEATRRLEAFIRDLQAKQRRVARTPPAGRARPAPGDIGPSVGLGALRGRLTWPAEGKVVAEFGAQVHPRFGTKTFRNGIDIEVAEGTSIVVVYPGHVLYTGWFRGYGNLIIVDHGNVLHASTPTPPTSGWRRAMTSSTDRSSARWGTPARSRGRACPRGAHQGKPQDPEQWLRPRG